MSVMYKKDESYWRNLVRGQRGQNIYSPQYNSSVQIEENRKLVLSLARELNARALDGRWSPGETASQAFREISKITPALGKTLKKIGVVDSNGNLSRNFIGGIENKLAGLDTNGLKKLQAEIAQSIIIDFAKMALAGGMPIETFTMIETIMVGLDRAPKLSAVDVNKKRAQGLKLMREALGWEAKGGMPREQVKASLKFINDTEAAAAGSKDDSMTTGDLATYYKGFDRRNVRKKFETTYSRLLEPENTPSLEQQVEFDYISQDPDGRSIMDLFHGKTMEENFVERKGRLPKKEDFQREHSFVNMVTSGAAQARGQGNFLGQQQRSGRSI